MFLSPFLPILTLPSVAEEVPGPRRHRQAPRLGGSDPGPTPPRTGAAGGLTPPLTASPMG